jgi:hypothetical protein
MQLQLVTPNLVNEWIRQKLTGINPIIDIIDSDELPGDVIGSRLIQHSTKQLQGRDYRFYEMYFNDDIPYELNSRKAHLHKFIQDLIDKFDNAHRPRSVYISICKRPQYRLFILSILIES